MLPVKSLMHFKCVSKSWRSLISSPNFIELHTKKAVDDKQVMLQRRRVMFNVGLGCRGLFSINLDQFLHDHANDFYNVSVQATELDFVRKEFALRPKDDKSDLPYISLIYFCNNLLCRASRCGFHELYFVNPATRELRKLPKTFHEIELPQPITCSSILLGVFRDCLCVTSNGFHDEWFDEFWVMKEYKVSESWSKVRLLKPYRSQLSHIGFSTESHDVVVYNKSLVMYDSFREETSNSMLQIRHMPDVLGNCVGVYVEGFFPLTSDWSMQLS